MKPHNLALAAILAAAGTQGTAQLYLPPAYSTLECTVRGSNETRQFTIGSGMFRVAGRGDTNWCEESGTTCKFEGSVFVAYDGESFDFSYDFATRAYSYSDVGGELDASGTCR